MKTSKKKKDAIPSKFTVNADQWNIMKLIQTCFTKRGLEISGWTKHIFIARKVCSQSQKGVHVSGRTSFQLIAYNLFQSKT